MLITEFTTAEGLFYAPERILRDFEYREIERPIVAQIYGHRPDDFYRATHVVCELGFDGIDINMGCPAKQVTQKNCGAKLIALPSLALEIIRATRQAIADWSRGQTLEDLKIPEKVVETVSKMIEFRVGKNKPVPRRLIPYSVKTRIGFDSVVVEEWVETLLQEKPAVIAIHGRTLKQLYKGPAQWDAIAQAAKKARGTGTLILGNGDIASLGDAARMIVESGVDGVLIGRHSLGNPWIFQGKDYLKDSLKNGVVPVMPAPVVSKEERFRVALEHARFYQEFRGEREFKSIRKHLIGYLSHIPEAAALRLKALQSKDFQELSAVLS